MPLETFKIDAVSGVKTNQYGEYFSIKVGNRWINVQGAPDASLKGRTVDAETKTSKDGKYIWAKINAPKEAPPPAQQANGSWEHYAHMARVAHALAADLEPDDLEQTTEQGGTPIVLKVNVDRSHARAAILNTVMIAYSNGKVALPAEPEPPEFGPNQQDDDIPF